MPRAASPKLVWLVVIVIKDITLDTGGLRLVSQSNQNALRIATASRRCDAFAKLRCLRSLAAEMDQLHALA